MRQVHLLYLNCGGNVEFSWDQFGSVDIGWNGRTNVWILRSNVWIRKCKQRYLNVINRNDFFSWTLEMILNGETKLGQGD